MLKRIARDILNVKDVDNSHYFYDESDITKGEIIMFGLQDSPYECGIFSFNIKFESDYPINPPILKHTTLTNSLRLHPNLYVDGKVCLSIINTWGQKDWGACISFSTLLTTIMSHCFVNESLRREPGFETINDRRIQEYDIVVKYCVFDVIIPNYYNLSFLSTSRFRNELINYYKRTVELWDTKINELEKYNNLVIKTYYNNIIKIDIPNLREKIKNVKLFMSTVNV